MTNPFEQLLDEPDHPLNLPGEIPAYEPLSSSHFNVEKFVKNKHNQLNAETSQRVSNMWTDDGFLQYPNNHDPIYLTKDKTQIDLITLAHRLKPRCAPYENHQWLRYISTGGLHYDSDSEYFISPLTAFFFGRWLTKGEHHLTPSNLRSFLSPHAAALVYASLIQFKVADPLTYYHQVNEVVAAIKGDRLRLSVGEHNYLIKLPPDEHREDQAMTPQMLKGLLTDSFETVCDSSGKIMRRDGKHPPFHKPGFRLPLWQVAYHELGFRITENLMQVSDLSAGCVGCPPEIKSACSFTYAKVGE